ncbi:MAG: rhodanese-like domain-containing protein [Candidatus Thiodiazotropha sp.]
MNSYRTIHRVDIQAHIKAGTDMRLVEALPEKYHREAHLPGALLLPHDEVRDRAEALVADKNAFIVVYCANTHCNNSRIAAQTLASMGYTNVAEYAEGKEDWIEQGRRLRQRVTHPALRGGLAIDLR